MYDGYFWGNISLFLTESSVLLIYRDPAVGTLMPVNWIWKRKTTRYISHENGGHNHSFVVIFTARVYVFHINKSLMVFISLTNTSFKPWF